MVAALARDFAPVCVLCLGDAELPPYQSEQGIEIYRLPGSYRDVLQRAMAFAQFVAFHAQRHAETLELIVYRIRGAEFPLRAALLAVRRFLK